MEIATGFAGNQGIRPDNPKYVAETLRQNGYSTAAFGKWAYEKIYLRKDQKHLWSPGVNSPVIASQFVIPM